MNRREFVAAAGGALSLGAVAAGGLMADDAKARPSIIEIRKYQLRNTPDSMRDRTAGFLQHGYVPAMARAGAGPVGVFQSSIGPDSPFILVVSSYPGMAELDASTSKLASDADYQKALEAYDSGALPYTRMEVSLLRAFSGAPTIEVPPPKAQGSRIFELRMYESNNESTLRRKVAMFNGGEAAIFKRLGMLPVFFGETIVGRQMPNLTYMLSFDDLAARDKLWRSFGGDPEWQKLRATPGWSDSEIVSNITNILVTPLPFSAIR